MNVVAVNASPNTDNGTTGLMLNAFLEGMNDEGAETETVYTRNLDIKPCIGCFHC